MIDANQGTSEETLRRLEEASYERFRIQLLNAVEKLLEDFEMTWDDLALKLGYGSGELVKADIGKGETLFLADLNRIAHCFSAEPYIIFRPRKPWIQS